MKLAPALLEQIGPTVAAMVVHPETRVSVTGRLLVDTGASLTVIDTDVSRAIGLRNGAHTVVGSAGAGQVVPLYTAELYVEDEARAWRGARWHPCGLLRVGALPDMNARYGTTGAARVMGLLGRDVLARARLIYDGAAGRFSLRF